MKNRYEVIIIRDKILLIGAIVLVLAAVVVLGRNFFLPKNAVLGCIVEPSSNGPSHGLDLDQCKRLDEKISVNETFLCEVLGADTSVIGTVSSGPFTGQKYTSHKHCRNKEKYYPFYVFIDGQAWTGCDGNCG